MYKLFEALNGVQISRYTKMNCTPVQDLKQ